MSVAPLIDNNTDVEFDIETWLKLAELVPGPMTGVTIRDNGCWIAPVPREDRHGDGRGAYRKVAYRTEDGKRTNTRFRTLAYQVAFDRKPVGTLANTCDDPDRCVNPDHLTDEAWGFQEDLEWLLLTEKTVTHIPARLGVSHATLLRKGSNGERGGERIVSLVERYQLRIETELGDDEERNAA